MPRPTNIVTKARGQSRDDVLRMPITKDADIVAARQAARQLAAQAGLAGTDLTCWRPRCPRWPETSSSSPRAAKLSSRSYTCGHRRGVQVTARDLGPGIRDVDRAMADGYSTSHGLGLGLPGARRLMDEFALASEVGEGTTVTMIKWCEGQGR
jgi:serine/threonine-protein kinase RsbT